MYLRGSAARPVSPRFGILMTQTDVQQASRARMTFFGPPGSLLIYTKKKNRGCKKEPTQAATSQTCQPNIADSFLDRQAVSLAGNRVVSFYTAV